MRGRELREKRGVGRDVWIAWRIYDVSLQFFDSRLASRMRRKVEQRMWTRIPPGVKNTYLNNTYAHVHPHHEWRIRIWTILYMHSCSSPPEVKNTYLNNTYPPVHHTKGEEYVSEQYIHSCLSHQWRICIWTIHTLLFITPGVKNTEQYTHSCSSHQAWRISIWTIHTHLFNTPWVKNTYLNNTYCTFLFIPPGVKNTYLNNTYTQGWAKLVSNLMFSKRKAMVFFKKLTLSKRKAMVFSKN